MTHPLTRVTSRRDALRFGGMAFSLGALAAACGEDRGGGDAPGRVGNAPAIGALPNYVIDDAVYLRTASSVEFTVIDAYETALGVANAIPDDLVPLIERLIEDHRSTAETMVSLTTSAGGDPWTCANPWLIDRLIAPVFEAILSPVVGTVTEDTNIVQVLGEELPIGGIVVTSQGELVRIADEDDLVVGDEIGFERFEGSVSIDVLGFAVSLETLGAAAHQELVLTNPYKPARIEHARAAALEARHASELAITTGNGDNYVATTLLGEEVTRDERGAIRQFAIPSVFATVSQIDFIAGPGDVNGVRTGFALQTPADNSLIYNELTCDDEA